MEIRSELHNFLKVILKDENLVKEVLFKLSEFCKKNYPHHSIEEKVSIVEYYDSITSLVPIEVNDDVDFDIVKGERYTKGEHFLYCNEQFVGSLSIYYKIKWRINLKNDYNLCLVIPIVDIDKINARIDYALRILKHNYNGDFIISCDTIQEIRTCMGYWKEMGYINDEYKIDYKRTDRMDFFLAIIVSLKRMDIKYDTITPKLFLSYIGYLFGSKIPDDFIVNWSSSWQKAKNK